MKISLSLIAAALLATISPALAGDPITDGSTITIKQVATQDFVIPPMTPLNRRTEEIVVTVSALGESTFTVDLTGPTPLLKDGSFFGTGVNIFLGRFELRTGPDHGFAPMTVTFENVVGDVPGNDFTADVVEFTVPEFGVVLIDRGVSLVVPDPFFFTGGTYDGFPPSPGLAVFADPFEANPPSDPTTIPAGSSYLPAFLAGGGPFVGYSTSRLVTHLPEPAAILSVAVGLAGAAASHRRPR